MPPPPTDATLALKPSGPYCVWPDENGGDGGGDSSGDVGAAAPSARRRYRTPLIGGSGFPVPAAYASTPRRRGWRVVGGSGSDGGSSSSEEEEEAGVEASAAAAAAPQPAAAAAAAAATADSARPSPPTLILDGIAMGDPVPAAAAFRARRVAKTPGARLGRPPKTPQPQPAPAPPRLVGRPRKVPLGPSPDPLVKRPVGRPKGSTKDMPPSPAALAARARARAARARAKRDAAALSTPVVFHRAPFRAEARRAAADAAAGDPGGGRTLGVTFFDDGRAPRACRAGLAAAALTAALARPDHAAALASAGVTIRIRVASITRLQPNAPPPRPHDPRLVSAAAAAGIELGEASPAIDPAAPAGADAVVEADLALVMDAYDAADLVREVAGMELVAPRGAYSRRVRPLGLYAARPGLPASLPSAFPLASLLTPDIDDPWAYGGTGSLAAPAEAWSFEDAAAACVAQVAAAVAGLAGHLVRDVALASAVVTGRPGAPRASPRAALAAAGLCPLLTPEADADWRRTAASRAWAPPSRRRAMQAAVAARPTIARPPAPAVAGAPLARAAGWRPLWLEDGLPAAAAAAFATVGGQGEEGGGGSGAPPKMTRVLYTLRSQAGAPRPVRLDRLPWRHWVDDPSRVDAALTAYIKATRRTAPSTLPTHAELRAVGGASLVAAISGPGGGVSAVAARIGLRPARASPGAWADPETLGAALRAAAAKAGAPGVMPSYPALAAQAPGGHGLAHAVRGAGGAAAAAAIAGLVCESRRGRPPRARSTADAPQADAGGGGM